MILPPCKDCESRKIGCHSCCDSYIKYKKELNDTKKSIIECQDYETYKNGKITKMQRESLRDIRRGKKDGDIMKKGKNKFIFCASFISFLILAHFALILSVCLEMRKSQNCYNPEILISTGQNLYLPKGEGQNFNLSLYECTKEAQLPEFGYDFDYVVGVVAAESRGEPYEGQVAVAQCILETSKKTLLTPEEVVKMKNRYAPPCEIEEEKEIVMDACINVFACGETFFEEPVEYFYSIEEGFVSDWHENNLKYVGIIGNHKFFMEG